MKLQNVWTRVVVVIYLVAIIGVCLYVPTYETGRTNFAYRWVWKGNQIESSGSHSTSIGTYDFDTHTVVFHNIDDYKEFVMPLSIDYGRVALEVGQSDRHCRGSVPHRFVRGRQEAGQAV